MAPRWRGQFHQKIQNPPDVVFGTAGLQLIVYEEIRQHLPKHPAPQSGLADPIGMDAMMHFDLWIVEYRVAEISYALGDEQLLVRQ